MASGGPPHAGGLPKTLSPHPQEDTVPTMTATPTFTTGQRIIARDVTTGAIHIGPVEEIHVATTRDDGTPATFWYVLRDEATDRKVTCQQGTEQATTNPGCPQCGVKTTDCRTEPCQACGTPAGECCACCPCNAA